MVVDHTFQPLSPRLNKIHKFLFNNNYVVTATDKNLGLAVSEQTWIIEKTKDYLSNQREYRRLEDNDTNHILRDKCIEMIHLAKSVEDYDWKYGNLSEFLCLKVTTQGRKHHILRSYGIPKIHKEPVNFRPILPCHSAIQNSAAKFISKMLKPLIAEAQTVIIGHKKPTKTHSWMQILHCHW